MAPSIPDRPPNEEALLASAQAGDERAFGRLLEHHRRELEQCCWLMLGDPDAVKRVIADTALTAWRERALVEPQTPVRMWLYRVAVRRCCEVAGDPMSLDDGDRLTCEDA
jgi:RNA polymerase sigma-70 factor, ECF subfamily